MGQSNETRAIQHLLLQGFEVLPCYAAVSTLLVDRTRLASPDVTWATYCDKDSLAWVSRLPDSEPLKATLLQCAELSAGGTMHVLCSHQSVDLVTALDPAGPARDALARIKGAIETSKAPPAEKLEAFGDEAVEAEYQRRVKKKEKQEKRPGEESPGLGAAKR